ncbi:MAG: galactokinase [Jatrophihabitans sp.]|uniref:galactokinase n=1 Tax=Jatrophihabitans sp. TaxID=1932789 RepID=UPI003F814CF0
MSQQSWCAWAPGRVNLIGEHTDYNDGFVLPLALPMGCRAEVAPVEGGGVTVRSRQLQRAATVTDLVPGASWIDGDDGWAAYAVGAVWALDATGRGWAIDLDSDVPLGAGLSSSAAVACATTVAVAAALGRTLSPDKTVDAATRAETEFVGAPTGGMDQLVSVRGRAGHALLCDMRSRDVEAVPFAPDRAGLALLVVDSRAPHRLVDGEYRARRDDCTEATRRLGVAALRDVTDLDAALAALDDDRLRRRVRHVVTENERVLAVAALLREARLAEIGPLLTASHASMRDDFEITVPEIDTAADTLLAHGALGARMTGGGFGGCVIALLPVDEAQAAGAAVAEVFARQGWNEPRWFVAEPSDGARTV